MHRFSKLSASVVIGLALAAAPAWVAAADDKKSATGAVKTTVSDSWITAKTKIALFADSRAPGAAVNVETTKGMVYLRGTVDSDAQKAAAGEVARGIEGVQGVKNELQVVPASAQKMVEAKDDEITKRVKDRFTADAKLKSLDIRTDNGVVTLEGKLPSITEGARASQMARGVPGVRSVRNDTTYDGKDRMTGDMRKDTRTADMRKDRTTGDMRKDTRTADTRKDSTTGDMRKDNRTADMRSTPQTHVRATQEKLKEKGYDPGPIDGVWGPRTAAAVSEYQRKENLAVTNRLDAETLGKLEVGIGGASRRQSP